jgi:hypothetical protein
VAIRAAYFVEKAKFDRIAESVSVKVHRMSIIKTRSKGFVAIWVVVLVLFAAALAGGTWYAAKQQASTSPVSIAPVPISSVPATSPPVVTQSEKPTTAFIKVQLKFREGSKVRLRNGCFLRTKFGPSQPRFRKHLQTLGATGFLRISGLRYERYPR